MGNFDPKLQQLSKICLYKNFQVVFHVGGTKSLKNLAPTGAKTKVGWQLLGEENWVEEKGHYVFAKRCLIV